MSIKPFLWDDPETAAVWPDGYDRVLLDETDSTMREAARRAPTLTRPTWILARSQTAAVGRRGRPWVHPAGNFSATLTLPISGPPAEAGLRSFIASLALFETLSMMIAQERLSLKWPNDVLLDGGKVAGILLESSGSAGRVDGLSIGIGTNLVAAPPASDVEPGAVPPVSITEQGGHPMRAEDMLFWLAGHFATHEQNFREFGFVPIRDLWLKNAARLGEVITARTPRSDTIGTFETVDEDGNLILNTSTGRVAIAAADVFF